MLIITCPCALGLAVPAVSSAAISKLYNLGFLVKSGTALERLAEIDTVVFDKTGTLTIPGGSRVSKGLSDDNRQVLAALVQSSAHPISRALSASLKHTTPASLENVNEVAGMGIEGVWNGKEVKLGRGDWVKAAFDGLALGIEDECFPISTEEAIRPGVGEAVESLKKSGLRTVLLF